MLVSKFLIPGYVIAVLKVPALFCSKLTGHDVSGWSSEVHNSSPCALNLGCILVGERKLIIVSTPWNFSTPVWK